MTTEEQAMKILLGTIDQIMLDSRCSYISPASPQYSELRAPGKELLSTTFNLIFPMLVKAHLARRKEDAENLMMDKLGK